MKAVSACEEFYTVVTEAHVLAAAMNMFGLSSMEKAPTNTQLFHVGCEKLAKQERRARLQVHLSTSMYLWYLLEGKEVKEREGDWSCDFGFLLFLFLLMWSCFGSNWCQCVHMTGNQAPYFLKLWKCFSKLLGPINKEKTSKLKHVHLYITTAYHFLTQWASSITSQTRFPWITGLSKIARHWWSRNSVSMLMYTSCTPPSITTSFVSTSSDTAHNPLFWKLSTWSIIKAFSGLTTITRDNLVSSVSNRLSLCGWQRLSNIRGRIPWHTNLPLPVGRHTNTSFLSSTNAFMAFIWGGLSFL